MKFNPFLRTLFALAIQTAVFAQPASEPKAETLKSTVILVIRHAEKSKGTMSLAPAGEERAKAYVEYFRNYKVDGKPLKLDYLIAAADAKTSHHGHPREGPYPRLTLQPVAKGLGLRIDNRFNDKHFQDLTQDLLTVPHGKAILIALHHEGIPPLLNALGVVPEQVLPNGSWPPEVFNWVIQLRFDAEGRLFEAKRINENLMPGDADHPAGM
jgi:hypothetical protein